MVTFQIVMVLGIVLFALYLFFKERFPVDVTALLIMIILMITKLVTPEEGISGFSNHAVITILAMFILSAAIEKTGLIHSLSLRIFGVTKSNEFLQLIFIMLLVFPMSGFLNNAAIVAVLLPFVLNLSKLSNTSPSKLLIPLSYVSMSAGMLTLIGTSTNLLANDVMIRRGFSSFGMFDFWKIGILVLGLTFLYFVTIGYWILPRNKNTLNNNVYENLKYTCEVKVQETSSLVGTRIKSSILRKKYKVRILRLVRKKKVWKESFSNIVLRKGDVLLIETSRDTLVNLETEPGIEIIVADLLKKESPDETLQVIIPHNSRFIGKKVKDLNLDKKYNAVVIAVRKGSLKIRGPLENVTLKLGDMLLIKTSKEFSDKIKQFSDLMVMDQLESSYRKDKRWVALAIMAGVVIVAALGIYPIIVTSLVGVILMLLTGVISSDEVYKSVRWDVIFLLAGLIPLGIALENSGAAAFIAQILNSLVGGLPLFWVLAGFYVFTTLLTEVLSNNASVILLVPIAIDLATRLGIEARILVLVIMFAASTSFLTPVGYKTNTMVYGTGVYKFSDFFRVGVFLNIILSLATPYFIMKIWGV